MSDEQKYEKLKAYVKQLAADHNALEERVKNLDQDYRAAIHVLRTEFNESLEILEAALDETGKQRLADERNRRYEAAMKKA